jgi:hypothetical protein
VCVCVCVCAKRPPIVFVWPQIKASDQKVAIHKTFLEFDCRGVFLCKNSEFPIIIFLGPTPKFKILSPTLLAMVLRFTKRYVTPLCEKNSGRDRFF